MVRVAILGAGLSGLACALELERQGLRPMVFERRDAVGDRFINAEVFLSAFSRPVGDEIRYLRDRFALHLTPLAPVETLVMHGPQATATLRGHFGWIVARGRHVASLERQLAARLRGPIEFRTTRTYRDLAADFERVVVATGDGALTPSALAFRTTRSFTFAGATVTGSFAPTTAVAWFDPQLAPDGQGFLIPLSEREASLVTIMPERPDADVDSHASFRRLVERAEHDLGQCLRPGTPYASRGFRAGLCARGSDGMTYAVGDCFGALMPLFAFGQFPALLTGVHAARAIVGLEDYEVATRPLRSANEHSLVLRQTFEGLQGPILDAAVRAMDSRFGSRLFTTRVDWMRLLAHALKAWMVVRRIAAPSAP